MKAGIFFAGSGPVLILTSYDSLTSQELIRKLDSKGIRKFIAYEIPVALVQARYGLHYDAIMSDLKQEDDLRVLDYDGHHIFLEFSFQELGVPIYYEPGN